MAVPSAYLATTKNTAAILDAMQKASVPPRFTYEFLKQLGYGSSGDRPFIPVLKALGFLTDGSEPTDRYRRFKDQALSKAVLAEAMRDAYSDLFAIDTAAHAKSQSDLKGMFARLSDKGDSVTSKMATTFKALAERADFSSTPGAETLVPETEGELESSGTGKLKEPKDAKDRVSGSHLRLTHDVHVHLPISTDINVYNAIFRSIKENLG